MKTLFLVRHAKSSWDDISLPDRDRPLDDRLYAHPADDLLDVIQALGDEPKRVMLVGHNPELTELAHRFSSEITHMPTCAIAEFTFDAGSWSNIGKTKPVQVALDYPKKP